MEGFPVISPADTPFWGSEKQRRACSSSFARSNVLTGSLRAPARRFPMQNENGSSSSGKGANHGDQRGEGRQSGCFPGRVGPGGISEVSLIRVRVRRVGGAGSASTSERNFSRDDAQLRSRVPFRLHGFPANTSGCGVAVDGGQDAAKMKVTGIYQSGRKAPSFRAGI